jgi:hypothetical protein
VSGDVARLGRETGVRPVLFEDVTEIAVVLPDVGVGLGAVGGLIQFCEYFLQLDEGGPALLLED